METCIEVQNVVKRFRDQVVLKNVSISFERERYTALWGATVPAKRCFLSASAV